MKRGIRLVAVGDTARLPVEVRRVLEQAITATAGNCRMTVALALSYGGRQDIIGAVKQIAQSVAAGALSVDQIDEPLLRGHLATAGLPDPDLLIRTSGEQRISNFFLYELAYTELYFTEILWPDFREREFLQALSAYQARERRFGALNGNGADHRLRAAN
jgi:undecaprenyl diphosphate synthase